jgi:hypothetical protein
LQSAKPWLSSKDIDKGQNWNAEISSMLDKSRLGIVCLTPENLHEPWVLFEAGALSKQLGRSLVCTCLLDLRPEDVPLPLGFFQHTLLDKEDTLQLLRTLNAAIGADLKLSEDRLDVAFDAMWPKLEVRIAQISPSEMKVETKRSAEDILAEVLDLLRKNTFADHEMNRDSILRKLDFLELGLFTALRHPAFYGAAIRASEFGRKPYNKAHEDLLKEYLLTQWKILGEPSTKVEKVAGDPTPNETSPTDSKQDDKANPIET